MREPGRCNRCKLRDLYRRHGEHNVRWAQERVGEMQGWIRVEVREAVLTGAARCEVPHDNGQREWRTAGHFAQLTAHCVC
jgi:hypothetical protein